MLRERTKKAVKIYATCNRVYTLCVLDLAKFEFCHFLKENFRWSLVNTRSKTVWFKVRPVVIHPLLHVRNKVQKHQWTSRTHKKMLGLNGGAIKWINDASALCNKKFIWLLCCASMCVWNCNSFVYPCGHVVLSCFPILKN